MNRSLRPVVALLALLPLLALPAAAAADPGAAWTRIQAAPLLDAGPRALVAPVRAAAFTLDRTALRPSLAAGRTLALPRPGGGFTEFRLSDAPVMTPGLARRHPEIRTFAGRALGDRATTVRLSVTPLGLHASVRGGDGRAWYVEPALRGDARRHLSFHRTALRAPSEPAGLLPPIGEAAAPAETTAGEQPGEPVTLRTYRLALVSDPPYATSSGAAGGLDPAAPDYAAQLDSRVLAAKVVLMSRVNQVYEADMAIRMLLIDESDALSLNTPAEATGANGPCGATACFTTSNLASCSSSLLTRNQYVAGLLSGGNFDVGHIVLGAGGGGIAGLGVVGDVRKAVGCTGLPKPVGDVFAIDYVAHELGHQFGGNHTFDGVNGSCLATNRHLTGARAMEPGSGSTVMAYAGICASDDLQAHSDPTFHQTSIDEITTYVRKPTGVLSSTQVVALRHFDGTDALTIGFEGRSAPAVVRGTNFTTAGVKAAIDSVLPEGGTVTVSALSDAGFQVVFGGDLAGEAVPVLTVAASGADAIAGQTVAGGPIRNGGTPVATANHAPAVTTGASYTIPVRTPLRLTATGSDADGDALTYVWEQNDGGLPGAGSALFTPGRPVGALFRTFGTAARYAHPDDQFLSPSPGQNLPSEDPVRELPDRAQVLADNTNARTGVCPVTPATSTKDPALVDCASEALPTASWAGTGGVPALHFRVTARDNHPGAGGTAFADTTLTLAQGAGPFRVLDLPALPVGAGTLPVAWDVARTDVLTGTPTVRITLSADGGKTFPIVLAASTPNDGVEQLPLPAGVKTTQGRVKVEAIGNVFFDVSHADLKIG